MTEGMGFMYWERERRIYVSRGYENSLYREDGHRGREWGRVLERRLLNEYMRVGGWGLSEYMGGKHSWRL